MRANLPENETARLAALLDYEVLDTLPEQSFDDITLLASQICDSPISLMTLVDSDRQWFKSKVGFDHMQTPRDVSFCAHAILQPEEMLIVPDAQQDERFVHNPLVTGDPHIRFYAGAPLVTDQGETIGTLCVIDRKPRDLSPQQQEALRALSRQVMAQLELRRTIIAMEQSAEQRLRAEAALQATEQQFKSAFEHAAIGMALVALDGHWLRVNRALCEIVGYSEPELLALSFQDITHPEDLDADLAFGEQLLAGEIRSFQMEKRYVHKQGHTVWVVLSKSLVHDAENKPIHFISEIQDITQRKYALEELRTSQEQTRLIVDTAYDAFVAIDENNRITDWNTQAEATFGWSRDEVLGHYMPDLIIPARFREAHLTGLRRFLSTGQGALVNRRVEVVALHRDGNEFPVEFTISPLRSPKGYSFNAFVRDITQRKQDEDKLQDINLTLATQVDELQQRTQELTLIGEMGELLQSCRTLDEADLVIGESLRQLFPNDVGTLCVMKSSQDQVQVVYNWGGPSTSQDFFAPDDCWALRRGRVYAFREGHTGLRCQHVINDPAPSYLCVPLVAQRETLGVLHISSKDGSHLTEAKQQLARTVSEQISLALANLKLQETLRAQSIRDPLTNLFNRRYLQETFPREIHRAQRAGTPLSVILFDIDHFKRFNDIYGHDVGDLVLRRVADLVKAQTRANDVACRYGGEEFLILLPDCGLESCQVKAEQLREAAEKMETSYQGQAISAVTLSLGVASFPSHGTTAQSLLEVADTALYRAKNQGRNRTVVAENQSTH